MNENIYESHLDIRRPITLLMKGPPGSGKTTKACQLPRPVLFSLDGNDNVINMLDDKYKKDLKIVRPRMKNGNKIPTPQVWANFIDQLKRVAEDPNVETIIVDSLTTLGNMLDDHILKTSSPSSPMEIQNWGEYYRYLAWLGDELLNADDLDKNVVFTAHERVIEKEDRETKKRKIEYKLLLGSSMKDAFELYFSDVWRCFVRTPGQYVQYWVRTVPDDEFMAKCSLPIPKEFLWDKERDNVIPHFKRK